MDIGGFFHNLTPLAVLIDNIFVMFVCGCVFQQTSWHLEIDSEGRLRTKLYDTRHDLNFPSVNFPFIGSNTPTASAYGVYISQLIRYSRACGFVNRYGLSVSQMFTDMFRLS